MIVRELITDSVPPVKSTDSVARALDWMSEFKLNQLPIVDNGNYVGLITENDVLEADSDMTLVGNVRYAGWNGAFIYQGNHVYDALEIMSKFQMEVLPVLDEENRYLGLITIRDLAAYFGRLFAVNEPGGILVLEIPNRGYVLSQIGSIVESADAKVLSLYLGGDTKGNLLVTLKLNVEDLSRVIAAFERFDYTVLRTYHKAAAKDDIQRNLEALLKYLEMDS